MPETRPVTPAPTKAPTPPGTWITGRVGTNPLHQTTAGAIQTLMAKTPFEDGYWRITRIGDTAFVPALNFEDASLRACLDEAMADDSDAMEVLISARFLGASGLGHHGMSLITLEPEDVVILEFVPRPAT